MDAKIRGMIKQQLFENALTIDSGCAVLEEEFDNTVDSIVSVIEPHIKKKCEEQRILCEEYATVHDFMPNDPIEDKIRNTPLATDK